MHGSAPLTLCITLACVSTAVAGLYGTSPIANTVWTAGRFETISWIDDKSRPRLDELGPLRISLFSGDDKFIATLAQDVNATEKSHEIWVSPSWGHNASDYYVVFASQSPHARIYTASFTIVGMSDVVPLEESNNSSISASASSTGSLSASSTTTSSSAKPSSTLPPISPEEESDYLHRHHASAGGAASSFDYERLKFRLVFIVWPALIGITMAL